MTETLWRWRLGYPTPLPRHDVPADLAARNITASAGDRSYRLAVNVPARTVKAPVTHPGSSTKAPQAYTR